MKFQRIHIIGVILFSSTLLAQTGPSRSSGIYATSSDYKNNQLEYDGVCGSKSHKLELHDVFNRPYIDLIDESQKHRIVKATMYGVHACDGYDYRFYANLEYRLLEAKEAYIYMRETHLSRYQSGRITTYYFSIGPDGHLLKLTIDNLKRAYLGNSLFLDSLDRSIDVHKKPEQYDESHKMFRVNYLLRASHTPES